MTLRMRRRIHRLALTVSGVAICALLVLPPAASSPVSDTEGASPPPIAEIDPGPIRETVGPRVSTAFAGRATGPGITTERTSPFADIPLAPEVLQESVIGPDGRTQVQDTTVYPNAAIGHLEIIQGTSLLYCTGWLIDRNTILTAGHCAYDGGTNNPIETAHFIPGRNAGVWPYDAASVIGMYAPYGWRIQGKPTHDWAVMQLNWDIGLETGWFGFYRLTGTNRFAGVRARVQGYPADKYLGTQWQMAGTVHHSTDREVFYPMDTAGGQSGAPVYKLNRPGCYGPCGFAIHAYGASGNPPNNSGTRITRSIFDKIIQIANQND